EPGFFARLAPGDGIVGLVRLDEAGDDFDLPRRTAGIDRRQAKLLDQDERVAVGVVERDRHRIAAAHHVVYALAAPGPGKEPVPESHDIDTQKPREPGGGFGDLDIGMRRHAMMGLSISPSADPVSISTTHKSGSRRRWRSI